ncbi:MAG: hypothetical protein Q7S80_02130 [bacterium]|nr:hypothetical protein [bacterium]
MNVELTKIKRTVYIVGFVLIVAAVAAVWFFTRAFATITVSPRTASVWLDGKQLKVIAGEASLNTSTGDHLLKIEANNYIGRNETVTLGRGFNRQIAVALTETPKPVQINTAGTFLMKGSDFNDGYYLSGSTVYKTKVGLDSAGKVNVIENRPITDAKINDVKEIIWSPSKDLALMRHSNGISLFDFMKYDFVHQTDTPWGGTDIGAVAWSPDNSKIAYYYAPASGEKSLVFANIINTEMTRVVNFAELNIENPLLRWSPDSEWLIVIPRNKDAGQNKIYLFNTYSRAIKPVTDNGGQTEAKFSPDSNKILFSTGANLTVMNKDGGNKTDLKIKANLSTVVWTKDSKNIIVAATDPSTNTQSIFRFDTEKVAMSGFSVKNLGSTAINSIAFSDDGKLILYEVNNAIYALKVE